MSLGGNLKVKILSMVLIILNGCCLLAFFSDIVLLVVCIYLCLDFLPHFFFDRLIHLDLWFLASCRIAKNLSATIHWLSQLIDIEWEFLNSETTGGTFLINLYFQRLDQPTFLYGIESSLWSWWLYWAV